MGLHAKWTTTCNHCGKQEVKELTPEQDDGSCYMDTWGPGFPDGWFQSAEDDDWIFYCSIGCRQSWLRAHDRADEAEKLNKAVWVA